VIFTRMSAPPYFVASLYHRRAKFSGHPRPGGVNLAIFAPKK